MAQKKISENPKITDEIIFELETPDDDGCLLSDPYKVDKIIIYFIERSFIDPTVNEYTQDIYEKEKLQTTLASEKLACDYPTEENIFKARKNRVNLESSITQQKFYYKDATPIFTLGNPEFPAWLSTDQDNALITKVSTDANGNALYGNFQYIWDAQGYREGDYFICFTWTSVIAGTTKSSHQKFNLLGDTRATAVPSHFTVPEKYATLFERYTPEIFKIRFSEFDRTPDVINKLNLATADGFTILEDYANQIIDLFDANVVNEKLLPFLSNLFSLKLKSNDPYLWRRQIKRAMPIFKKKGTISGLIESLDQSGIKFIKYTRLWQVISDYTWQEVFAYDGNLNTFVLEKTALSLDLNNFELYVRYSDSDTWELLTSDYIEFGNIDGISTMEWVGDTLSVNPITLEEGDSIRVLYKYNEINSPSEQSIEDYVRTLSLSDTRDERDQEYPLKNWNVRLIEETDPLFDVIIPTKNPFHDNVIFGKVKTEFPFSENIYNMDEYNGSIRSSNDPCDIDKNFIDPCFSSLSSKYNIDLEIKNLSDDRIVEAYEVLSESLPFHAILHVMNIYGGFEEVIMPPIEEIEALMTYKESDFIISGNAQMWFNRIMKSGRTTSAILRNALASSAIVDSGSGTAYNDSVVLFSGEVNFKQIGVISNGTGILKILGGTLAGEYTIQNPVANTIEVNTISEPLDETNSVFSGSLLGLDSRAFSFRISNPIDSTSSINIYQDNIFSFSDSEKDFSEFKSLWDVSEGYSSGSWKIKIIAYSATAYDILNILPNKILLLQDDGTLPPASVNSVSYEAYDKYNNLLFASTSGKIVVTSRGRTEVLNSDFHDVRNIYSVGFYQKISGIEYRISGFVDGTVDQFYIENYTDGDVIGTSLEIFQRLVDNKIGYMSHKGFKIQIVGDLESSLGIVNGANNLVSTPLENDYFKENYLIEIDGDLYFIEEIDGNNPSGNTTITLEGSDRYWKTLSSGGTSESYTIYRHTKTQNVTIAGQQFDLPEVTFNRIDRRGSEMTVNSENINPIMSVASEDKPKDNFVESLKQNENIQFTIDYKDGNTKKGEL